MPGETTGFLIIARRNHYEFLIIARKEIETEKNHWVSDDFLTQGIIVYLMMGLQFDLTKNYLFIDMTGFHLNYSVKGNSCRIKD